MASISRTTTIWVPVSPTSGANEFPIPSMLLGVSDLLFEFVNPNPFDIALEGTPANSAFNQASWPGASWLVLARERTKVYISKQPTRLSAQAVETPGCPLPDAGYDYSLCFLGLVYGKGRMS